MNQNEDYNFFDGRYLTARYKELLPDETFAEGGSVIEWDEKNLEVRMKLSINFSDKRMLEIFQGVLDNTVKAAQHEREKNVTSCEQTETD